MPQTTCSPGQKTCVRVSSGTRPLCAASPPPTRALASFVTVAAAAADQCKECGSDLFQPVMPPGMDRQSTLLTVENVRQHFSRAFHSPLLVLPNRRAGHLFISICLLFVLDPACFSNELHFKQKLPSRRLTCATVPPASTQKKEKKIP